MGQTRKRPRRISFGEYQAAHLFDWLAQYWNGDPNFGDCGLCQELGVRLERFIGRSEAQRLMRLAKRERTKQPAERRRKKGGA